MNDQTSDSHTSRSRRGPITLRFLLGVTTFVACVAAALVWFGKAQREAMKDASRQAVRAGRLEPEDARLMLDDEVDELKKDLERKQPTGATPEKQTK